MTTRDRANDALRFTLGHAVVAYERLRTGVAFNPFDRGYFSDPYPRYARLRTRDPVHKSAVVRGWVLTRYEDVLWALRHPDFSADERNMPGFERQLEQLRRAGVVAPDEQPTRSMLRSDPPDHTRLRKLVSKVFTPGAVRRLAPKIQALVAEQLDAAEKRGELDVIRDLAVPLPVIVIAEMIGVPREDRERFWHWSNEVVRTLGFSNRSDERRAFNASRELTAYFERIAAERRREPRDDLMSGLLAAEEEGDRLTGAEVFATLQLLLVAGNETTTNLIGNGVLSLLRNPDQLDALRADPGLLDSGLEELLRYDSPVQATSRIALRDLELREHSFRRGQEVLLFLGAANRDPERFPQPDRLDLARADNAHLAFGHGIHFCLGANLARLEGRHAIAAVVERFPGLKLATDRLEWRDNHILHGLRSLPVRF